MTHLAMLCVCEDGEFVLGPFSLSDGTIVYGCASVHWDDVQEIYDWTAYLEIGGTEIRGCWPIDHMPHELTSTLARMKEAGE